MPKLEPDSHRERAMSNIYSILQSGYANAVVTTPSSGKYTAVDPKSYQGTWTGTYAASSSTPKNDRFSFQISNVQGFRAMVRFQNGSTVSNQQVLIKNSAFTIGDTRFALTGTGKAHVGTAVTNATTGNVTLITGNATQS